MKKKVGPHVRPSMTGKKFGTKMKSFKRKLIQPSYSDSDADEGWVSWLSSGGWSGQ